MEKLKNFDLFGAPLTLKLKEGQSRFKTLAGSIYTIVVAVLLAAFIVS
jgi:hypothetical protein